MVRKKFGFYMLLMVTVLNLALSFSAHAPKAKASAECRNRPSGCTNVECFASCTGTCQCNGGRNETTCWCNCSDGSSSWNSCSGGGPAGP